MKLINSHFVALLAAAVLPMTCLAAETKEAPGLPACAQPLGSLQVPPVACDALTCQRKTAAPQRGFGLGGLALKAVDHKKLAVTPAALERSGEDLTRMLREAFSKTGCFKDTTVDATGENAKSDYQVVATIVRMDIKSTKSRFGGSTGQAIKLDMDVQISRAGQPDSEKISIASNSEKPTVQTRHAAQLFHTQEEATALDLAMADAAIQAVNEATKRLSGAAVPPAVTEK